MVGFRPISLALLLLALLPASATADTASRIIVKRDAGLTAAERADIRADAGVSHVESLPLPRTEVVAAAPGDARDALRDLNADPDVAYAELDRPVKAFSDDEYFQYLWGLQNLGNFLFGTEAAVNDADMDVPDAWELSTGAGRTVAVVDSGVDAAHEDLGGRVLPGWDFVQDDPYAADANGHGTHVAGTIAATRDNDVGIAGVAPDSRILPLRVLDAEGAGLTSHAAAAFDYAGDRGVRIVNVSLGGEGYSQTEYDAIADHPETLFVVAAGNDGVDLDAAPQYPCAYDLPNILCVGASRHDDTVADFSNFGALSVDVFAPGYGIYSTQPGNAYDWADGTSMASPHVAGSAALLLARNPELAAADVKLAILDNDEDKPAMTGKVVSDGRANANASLRGFDFDVDGFADGLDNCPAFANAGQDDVDENGIGDACDPPPADPDGDATVTDDCPYEAAGYAADGCPSGDPSSDGDFWPDAVDQCPAVAGPVRGCPDSDGDRVADWADNCASVANAGQSNIDGDGLGDACDDDRDGDTRPNASDTCPNVFASTSNGCPTAPAPTPPTPPANRDGDNHIDVSDSCPDHYALTADGCPLAQVASVSPKVRKRGTVRSVAVKIRTSRPATLRVTIERRRGTRWVRVLRRSVVASNTATVRASRLRRGRHRIRIRVSSAAGTGPSATKSFRVR